MSRVRNRLSLYYRLFIARDPYTITTRQWFRDQGDQTLRVDYPLNSSSVVFDVGGYQGRWSQDIASRYNANIFVFEPVPQFFEAIRERFKDNPKVRPFNFGLGAEDATLSFSVRNDSSTCYRSIEDAQSTPVTIKSFRSFLEAGEIHAIDLIKINIEGGEYPLLESMLDAKITDMCRDIQVQFHTFYPRAVELRHKIRERLAATHELTYDYPFMWENWRRKDV